MIQLFEEAENSLASNLHFEYLEDDSNLWEYACDCATKRSMDHVQSFIKKNFREIEDCFCFFPVEHLVTKSDIQIGDPVGPTAPCPATGTARTAPVAIESVGV